MSEQLSFQFNKDLNFKKAIDHSTAMSRDEHEAILARVRYSSVMRNERPHGLDNLLEHEVEVDRRVLSEIHPIVLISMLLKTEEPGRDLNIRLARLMAIYLAGY